jgi:lincosamide nucleotidyltransferase A/C/D/E
MDTASMIEVLDALEGNGLDVWIDGGWGVDALLGEQVREHDDLDLVADLRDSERIVELLAQLGYEHVAGGPPKSFVLVDSRGRQVDVHPVSWDERGGGIYEMDDDHSWVYPPDGFTGRGYVGDRPVRCLNPEVQVLVHAGYELGEKDYRELALLRERFGVELPEAVVAAMEQL